MQELLDGDAQEEFEAANPLPDSFVNGTRSMLATFITAGCDTVGPHFDSVDRFSDT